MMPPHGGNNMAIERQTSDDVIDLVVTQCGTDQASPAKLV
ncbi:hypothetical protein Q31b_26940 [Novipirellula aureliae]|uniref:Uncharacterized protein n=1 Tax=Novipirellula aureliae TaxID=2527966 RepID=A0A5C6DXW7_9BACT|nr:hypothetical protein Q31b_26940 [Novipirellula aureliae]